MISMFSNHFIRWAEQLNNTEHEVYWVDVFDSNLSIQSVSFTNQIIGWRNKINYPGRYWVKRNMPLAYEMINLVNQRKLEDVFEKKMREIQPDVVHSFVLQSATYPLINVMKKFPHIKWIYSAWGNDLFYRKSNIKDLKNIQTTLPKIDYMFADCTRDYFLAKDLGFKGEYLGTFPTGGGYDLKKYFQFRKPYLERRFIVVKGYEGKLGRANSVLEAIVSIKESLEKYKVVVYGANQKVYEYCKRTGLINWPNFEIRNNISHEDVLKLMGEAFICVGNSISDGLPNTLLECMVMGSYPIQSNPGGATSELIAHSKNGLIIEDPADVKEISRLLILAIKEPAKNQMAIDHNSQNILPFLERSYVRKQVLMRYAHIQNTIKVIND